jgi:uncharacterized phage protein (TIGR01671 family)
MREIRFRQPIFYGEPYKSKLRQWHYWGYVDKKYEDTFTGPIDRVHGGDSYQFTGLKDKNEKEIYEGDIVEYNDLYNDLGEIEQRIKGQVVFIKDRSALMIQEIQQNTRGGNYIVLWDQAIQIEVIGNIYENPEGPSNTN